MCSAVWLLSELKLGFRGQCCFLANIATPTRTDNCTVGMEGKESVYSNRLYNYNFFWVKSLARTGTVVGLIVGNVIAAFGMLDVGRVDMAG